MNSLVSIIMPSFNTGKYISDSIKSVLEQTYKNWELIIVDDCSVDDTDEVVKSFKDARIKYFKNQSNSGAAVSRNKALKEANGRWIAFLDSDDLWSKDKLEKQIRFMEDNNYSFSYTNYSKINEDGNPLGVLCTGPSVVNKRKMYRYCYPGCLTVMYDSTKIGLIQINDIKKNNDYAMWLVACKKEKCYLLPECLAQYRIRKKSISHDKLSKKMKSHYDLYRICDNKSAFSSFWFACWNMWFGIWKKIKYEKVIKK